MMQREYTWSSIFAWGLTLSGAVLATGGAIGMFWPELDIGWACVIAFAGMMAFGIGLVNCAAAGALQAIKHRKPDGRQVDWSVLLPALACTIGFVFATNVGVHMGWEIVIAQAPQGAKLPPAIMIDAVFYIFAFAKPAMSWIVEGRKAMDAEAYAAHRAMRRQEALEIAEADMIRAEFQRVASGHPIEAKSETVQDQATGTSAPDTVSQTQPQVSSKEDAHLNSQAEGKPRATRSRRRARTVEEQRAAAMKAAAKRVMHYREQFMDRVTDLEQARLEQALTVQQIAGACDELLRRGETPSFRRAAEILGVSQSRVEKVWPSGVPLDGTGEFRAA